MNKKLFFMTIVLSLILIGSVNAYQDTMHQHITREAFKFHQMSFPKGSTEIGSYVSNLGVNSFSNNLFTKQLNYQNDIGLKNYMQNNLFLLKNNSETIENNLYLNNQHTLMSVNGFSYYCKKMNTNNQKNEYNVKEKVCYYGKQFIIGEFCGVGCSLLSAVIAGPFYPKGQHGIVGAAYVASVMYIGYTVGNSIGVYWSGKTKYNSSYLKTLIGSIIGATVGFYIFDQCDAKGPLCSALVLGPPIGSILGFNLSREPRELPHGQALINYDRDGLKWSLSNVSVYYDYYHKPVLNVNLFQANF